MSKNNSVEVTPAMTGSQALLFAVASGAAVGNLYWAQPLLDYIADAFEVSTGSAGLLVTATQIGYALGIFFLVPLGDVVDRRRFIPAVMLCSAAALILSAFAPSFPLLLAALMLVGFSTVSGQLLIPLASDLAGDRERSRLIGMIVSGILIGILASRTISGLMADLLGWRAIYIAAAVVTVLLALVMRRTLPQIERRQTLGYLGLLKSVFTIVAKYPSVQVTLLLGAMMFAVFTLFWTGLTFLLSSAPYGYSAGQIGLVGLAGLTGAVAARRCGGLHDRGLSVPATGIFLLLLLVSLILADLGAESILLILIAVILLDVAIQGMNVLNQSRLMTVDSASRSRLNTAFIVCNFAGGAIGSALAGLLWSVGGWHAISMGEILLTLCALVLWFFCRNGALNQQQQ
ncbi:MFS transporter [Marinobacterium lutimaris]|uniref:Predicted arabinose efflux permease, MFS family n=1 Tax=Marinobacterium lutimaris TaxID=568106 RepID=A0A1H6CXQ7_9GAMM|nr:MFS transporter [Marinobacterium lutimaris]SEG77295.1 Predicted arabinose efflux permease, MFS family [Marinobacterium lutimaris]